MILQLLILFAVSFLVRLATVTIGGGGMILIPLLIFLGLSPSQAIATNRFSSFSINASVYKFFKKGLVKLRLGLYLSIPAILGSILGAFFVININQEIFQKLLGFIILVSLPFLFFKNNLGLKEFNVSKTRVSIGIILTFLAGFLGGAFASTGLWLNYVLLFFGLTMLQIAGTRKIIGTAIGTISFLILAIAGLVNWPFAIVMFFGNGLGAWIGAGIGIKAGDIWVKRLFAFLVIISAIKLIFF